MVLAGWTPPGVRSPPRKKTAVRDTQECARCAWYAHYSPRACPPAAPHLLHEPADARHLVLDLDVPELPRDLALELQPAPRGAAVVEAEHEVAAGAQELRPHADGGRPGPAQGSLRANTPALEAGRFPGGSAWS